MPCSEAWWRERGGASGACFRPQKKKGRGIVHLEARWFSVELQSSFLFSLCFSLGFGGFKCLVPLAGLTAGLLNTQRPHDAWFAKIHQFFSASF